ncbi:MAG: prepilin-type N-terminal cleavage/methylation domain-containing protein [Acidobacteria bacterium]|nr:prepilin-type N-terminal cleavage/methylation domain-containing protein [Acidobacteriota bacterium]
MKNSLDASDEAGFTLAELMISMLIFLVLSSGVFALIIEMERAAGYQAEVQAVLNNSRLAIQTVGRLLRQAGNDPGNSGLAGITIVSPSELRVRADITGSAGAGNPDKGDPDGDTVDSGEDVTIRYNSAGRSLELVPDGGPAQIVALDISDVRFDYYDSSGSTTSNSADVRRIGVSVSGSATTPDPRSRQVFAVTLSSEFHVQNQWAGL